MTDVIATVSAGLSARIGSFAAGAFETSAGVGCFCSIFNIIEHVEFRTLHVFKITILESKPHGAHGG